MVVNDEFILFSIKAAFFVHITDFLCAETLSAVCNCTRAQLRGNSAGVVKRELSSLFAGRSSFLLSPMVTNCG